MSKFFSDADLGVLADIVALGHGDKQRMMREDDEILQAVIPDRGVFEYLTKSEEPVVWVSPLLFDFIVESTQHIQPTHKHLIRYEGLCIPAGRRVRLIKMEALRNTGTHPLPKNT